MKQPVTRTQSAPLRSHGMLYGGLQMSESQATDTEINARLDSLCRSVTECALAGSGNTLTVLNNGEESLDRCLSLVNDY